MIEVPTVVLRGTYEELADAAEDLEDILDTGTSDLLDLTPTMEKWLINQLECIESALTEHLAHDDRRTAAEAELARSAA